MKLSVEGSEATDVITLDETTEGESERSLNEVRFIKSQMKL